MKKFLTKFFLALIIEFKKLVKKYHDAGINVIVDVVFNHVYKAAESNFDVLMPGYYFRYNEDVNPQIAQEDEAAKLKIRNLTNYAFNRKFFGSKEGYKMFASSVFQHASVYSASQYIPLEGGNISDFDTMKLIDGDQLILKKGEGSAKDTPFHFKIFDDISFEIDDNGTPYWIAPTITYKVALWDGEDIDGAVLVNAQTGESKFYELKDIPTWVDQVFISNLIIRQLVYHGRYVNGYINSILGQKGVLRPTDGYNYLAINDDVYLYTGLTSVMSDASNVGFVLVNLRTKEAKYYNVPGAEELSAMSSAMGKVQHLNYKATFPILLNINNRPTYFLSLKDGAGLVKMYAFVDVEQYQVVGTGNTVNQALENFFQTLGVDGTPASTDVGKEKKKTGTISAMSQAVVSGNTAYYLILTDDKKVYRASIEISERLPFLHVGDKITFVYQDNGKIGEIKELQ